MSRPRAGRSMSVASRMRSTLPGQVLQGLDGAPVRRHGFDGPPEVRLGLTAVAEAHVDLARVEGGDAAAGIDAQGLVELAQGLDDAQGLVELAQGLVREARGGQAEAATRDLGPIGAVAGIAVAGE